LGFGLEFGLGFGLGWRPAAGAPTRRSLARAHTATPRRAGSGRWRARWRLHAVTWVRVRARVRVRVRVRARVRVRVRVRARVRVSACTQQLEHDRVADTHAPSRDDRDHPLARRLHGHRAVHSAVHSAGWRRDGGGMEAGWRRDGGGMEAVSYSGRGGWDAHRSGLSSWEGGPRGGPHRPAPRGTPCEGVAMGGRRARAKLGALPEGAGHATAALTRGWAS
jgi:hypothetical protein